MELTDKSPLVNSMVSVRDLKKKFITYIIVLKRRPTSFKNHILTGIIKLGYYI